MKFKISHREFVLLIAILMSMTALSIDTMLPALSTIGNDLHVEHQNDTQLIISTIFLGISLGMVLYGPLSDSFGRKPALYLGLSIFIIGCIISIMASSLTTMLIGRLLQGFGVASPRIVTMALVRDKFSGQKMAQVMSFAMTLFVLVPAVAPLLGQVILLYFNWHAIFVFFILIVIIILLWFGLRMEETLAVENRRRFKINIILDGTKETLKNPIILAYIAILAALQGAFIGFLSSSKQVFLDIYSVDEQFPFYFSMLALSLGVASFINGKLVLKYGTKVIAKRAIMFKIILALVFLSLSYYYSGAPLFVLTMVYFMLCFFSMGLLFGNLNAMAMEPLGHIAGVGASVIGAFSTFFAVPISILIGKMYNETVLPLVWGFFCVSVFSSYILHRIEKVKNTEIRKF